MLPILRTYLSSKRLAKTCDRVSGRLVHSVVGLPVGLVILFPQGILLPPLPSSWVTMKMYYSNHLDKFRLVNEENAIWKTLYNSSTNLMVNNREPLRVLRNT